ncbi:AAA family ATPase [Bacillota bacterium LX-D]|nr:AAA family ATPase [Bacillota bacterium LX-D]
MEKYFQKGEQILLKPQSEFYNGIYPTEILALEGNLLTISQPYDSGKIVIIGIGTKVTIIIADGSCLTAEVIERKHGKNAHLVLLLPRVLNTNSRLKLKGPRVISVTSGKGGVGKTNLCVNLAISLARKGLRTFIIDADLGTANTNILFNIKSRYNLEHLLSLEMDIFDIIVEGPEGIFLVPGNSGSKTLANLSNAQILKLIAKFQKIENLADVIIIDTSAGIGHNVINFVLASDEVILITTPEPTALTDAYALVKVLSIHDQNLPIKLVINHADNRREARKAAQHLLHVIDKFLPIKVDNLGYILEDKAVIRAIKHYTSHVIYSPNAPSSQCIEAIAQKLVPVAEGTLNKSFFDYVKKMFIRQNLAQ